MHWSQLNFSGVYKRHDSLNCPDKCEDHFPFRLKIFLHVTLQNEGVVHRGSPWTRSMKGSMDRGHRGGPLTWGPCLYTS